MKTDGKANARRDNAGKPRFDLLPPDGLTALAEVYTAGAEKYGDRNWEQGLFWGQGCFASLMRHANAWAAGEDRDPETGKHHMAHVAWNAIALVVFHLRGIGIDDRTTGIKK